MRLKALFLLLCLFTLPSETEAAPAASPAPAETRASSGRSPASLEHSMAEAEKLFRQGQGTDAEVEKRKFHSEGFRLSEEALKADPDHPAAILQWTMHASAIAALDKNLAALARIKEIETALLRLRDLNPGYRHAAADRTLGLLYRNAPMIISVGSTVRAGRHLKAAFALDPAYPGNCIFLADYYLSEGEKREARRLTKECGTDDRIAAYPEEAAEWTKIARRILDKTRS